MRRASHVGPLSAAVAAALVAAALAIVGAGRAEAAQLIANPSLETAAGSGSAPAGWAQGGWGTNTRTYSWSSTARTGSRSARVTMSARSTGDVKWMFDHVRVSPNTQYTYSDWYQANVQSQLVAEYRSTTGALSYVWFNNQPASATTWRQATATFTTPANVATMTVFHLIARNGNLTIDDVSLDTAGAPPAPPTVVVSAPTAGSSVSGAAVVLSATTTGSGVLGVRFRVDGVNVGVEDTTAPYSVNWNSTGVSNGAHTVTAVVRTASTSVTSVGVSVTVSNAVAAPTVVVSAPTAGSSVSGAAVVLSATTTGSGVLGVRFRVDGVNVGVEDTTAPYSVNWNSTGVSNGAHTVTAVVRTASTSVTSAGVSVTVSNAVAPPTGEVVPNPSVETANGSAPTSWQADSWGTIAASFTYPTGAAHSGTRFVRVDVTSRSSGDAKWYFASQPVTAGTLYRFTDWYRSNTSSQVVVEATLANGSQSYLWLTDLVAAPSWTQYTGTFTMPANTVRATVFHLIASTGFLELDDQSLIPNGSAPPPPPGTTFTQPLVSLAFDDGWISHATAALPALQAHGKTGTFYILSGEINVAPYMSGAQILSLKNAGMEIGSHTVSHPHLPEISSAQQDTELQQSRTTLEALIGAPVPSFCSPYGEYNATVLTKIKAVYGSHRTVNEGVNTKANTDPYELLVRNVYNTTTRAEVEGWLADAKAQNGWVILVFHNIVTNPDTYDSSPAMLEQYLQAVDQSGITVKTIAGALAEVRPQLA